jgi:hypothetical protein
MLKYVRLSILAAATFGSFGSASLAQQSPNMTFFVTSVGSGKGGDLGGLAGADALCGRLAQAVGAGNKVWRAYLSTTAQAQGRPINARDRIGNGPWQNFKGDIVAKNVDDLHSASNNLNRATALTERGTVVAGFGMTPNWHDVLTGSTPDGRAFPANLNLTCNNWTSSDSGRAMLGHIDRTGAADNEYQRSWNSSHQSRSCSQDALRATGGNGLLYCFAAGPLPGDPLSTAPPVPKPIGPTIPTTPPLPR